VQGADHGDAYEVLKGGVIGAIAGALLSLLLACAAMTGRPGHGAPEAGSPEPEPPADAHDEISCGA